MNPCQQLVVQDVVSAVQALRQVVQSPLLQGSALAGAATRKARSPRETMSRHRRRFASVCCSSIIAPVARSR
jgi:hypothetical protein